MSTVTELLNNPESVGVWTLDADQSTITFNNKTMWGAMKVNGVFTEFSGDGKSPTAEHYSAESISRPRR